MHNGKQYIVQALGGTPGFGRDEAMGLRVWRRGRRVHAGDYNKSYLKCLPTISSKVSARTVYCARRLFHVEWTETEQKDRKMSSFLRNHLRRSFSPARRNRRRNRGTGDWPVPTTRPRRQSAVRRPKGLREGKSWFRGVCALCHGGRADGQGERGTGADLRKFNMGFRAYVEVVKKGREVPGRIQDMPAWGAVSKRRAIYEIGAYLETLALDGANWKEGVPN